MSDATVILNEISPAEINILGLIPTISVSITELEITPGEINLTGKEIIISGGSVELLVPNGSLNITGIIIDVNLGDTLTVPAARLELSGGNILVGNEVFCVKAETFINGIAPTISGNLSVELIISPAEIYFSGNNLNLIAHVHSATYLYIPAAKSYISGSNVSSELSLEISKANLEVSGNNSISIGLFSIFAMIIEFPSFEMNSYSGGFLSPNFPIFDLAISGTSGHDSNLVCKFPELNLNSYCGSNLDLTLNKLSFNSQAEIEINADIVFNFPAYNINIKAKQNSVCDLDITFPKILVAMDITTGIVGNIINSFPKLLFTGNVIQGYTSNIEASIRILTLNIIANNTDPANINIEFEPLDIVITSGEITSDVLIYVRNRIR
jgi:hypothetical protein